MYDNQYYRKLFNIQRISVYCGELPDSWKKHIFKNKIAVRMHKSDIDLIEAILFVKESNTSSIVILRLGLYTEILIP